MFNTAKCLNKYKDNINYRIFQLTTKEVFKMFFQHSKSTPVSRNQLTLQKFSQKIGKRTQKKPNSGYRIRPQELSALKQRIKMRNRNRNKQNNILFKSQNIMGHLFCPTPQFQSLNYLFTLSSNFPTHIHTDKLQIDQFEIGDLIGKGAQAKVRIAYHKATCTIYSLKTISRNKIQKNIDSFLRSLKIQMFLNHPNIAKIYGIIVQNKNAHLIMQYCIDGDLTMNKRQFGKQNKHVKNVLHKITQGLSYLHSLRIHHRDLKLQNILYCCGVPKITDFQLSVYTKLDFFPRKTICGSPAYFCPQMIQKQRYNKKADIWCLGIIFYQLLCGYFPFNMYKIQDLTKIIKNQIQQFPAHLSPLAADVINKMLCKQSEARISIDQVLDHQFFKNQHKQFKDNKFQKQQ